MATFSEFIEEDKKNQETESEQVGSEQASQSNVAAPTNRNSTSTPQSLNIPTSNVIPKKGMAVLNSGSEKTGNSSASNTSIEHSGNQLPKDYVPLTDEQAYDEAAIKRKTLGPNSTRKEIAEHYGAVDPELEDTEKKKKAIKWTALSDGLRLLTQGLFATRFDGNDGVDIGGNYDAIGKLQKEISEVDNRNTAKMDTHNKFIDQLRIKLLGDKENDDEKAYNRRKAHEKLNMQRYKTRESISEKEYENMSKSDREAFEKDGKGGFIRKGSRNPQDDIVISIPKENGVGTVKFPKSSVSDFQSMIGAMKNDKILGTRITTIMQSIRTESGLIQKPDAYTAGDISTLLSGLATSDDENGNVKKAVYLYMKRFGLISEEVQASDVTTSEQKKASNTNEEDIY